MIDVSAPLTLYVDPLNGADVPNAGFFPTMPAKSPPYLLDQLPEMLRYLVTMQLAAGAYSGFLISGFLAKPALGQTAAGLNIVGTYVAPTGFAPADVSGVLSSVVPGNAATPTFTLLGDDAKSWTPGALKRKFVQIGVSRFPISDNDATHLTLASTAAVATPGAAYSIVEKGSVITSSIPNGPGSSIGLGIFDNECSAVSTVVVEAVDVNAVAGVGISARANLGTVRLKNCSMLGALGIGFDFDGAAQSLLSSGCIAAPNSGNFGMVCGYGNVVYSGGIVTCPSGKLGVGVQPQGHGSTLSLGSSLVENSQFGMKVLTTGGAHFELSGTTVDTGGGSQAIVATSQGHNQWGNAVFRASGLRLQNASTGLQLGGGVRAWIDSLQGTNNSIGVQVDRGARCQLGPASGISGTVEVLMDGTATTLAAMRANSPKLISNPYNSMLFE